MYDICKKKINNDIFPPLNAMIRLSRNELELHHKPITTKIIFIVVKYVAWIISKVPIHLDRRLKLSTQQHTHAREETNILFSINMMTA